MQPGQSPSDSPLLTSLEWAASVRVADLLPEVPSVGTYRRPQVAAVCDFVCVFFSVSVWTNRTFKWSNLLVESVCVRASFALLSAGRGYGN